MPQEKKKNPVRVYISGKITGEDPAKAAAAFAKAEDRLRTLGAETINPLKDGLQEDAPWIDHIIADLALLKSCDLLYCTCRPCESVGADIELAAARRTGIPIVFSWRKDDFVKAKLEEL